MNHRRLISALATVAIGAFAFTQFDGNPQGGPPQGGGQGGQFGPPPGGGQGGPGGMRMGMGRPMGPGILMMKEVQDELKLTNEQKEQIQKLLPQRQPGQGGPGGQGGFGPPPGGGQGGQGGFGPPPGGGQGGQGGFGPPPGGGQGQFGRQGGPGQGGPGQDRMRQMEKKIKEILNETQYKRYQELSLQAQGAPAMLRPEIASKLGLTEDQVERMQEEMELAQVPDLSAPQRPEDRRKQIEAKLVAILNGSQKDKWQAMLGKPFKFPEPQPRRNG